MENDIYQVLRSKGDNLGNIFLAIFREDPDGNLVSTNSCKLEICRQAKTDSVNAEDDLADGCERLARRCAKRSDRVDSMPREKNRTGKEPAAMLAEVVVHGFAFVMRAAFFLMGALSLLWGARRSPRASASVPLALAASLCLTLSSIAAREGGDALVLAGTFVLIAVAASAAQRACALGGFDARIVASASLLLTVGMVVACDISDFGGGASPEKFALTVVLGLALAALLARVVVRWGVGWVAAAYKPLIVVALVLFALPFAPLLGASIGGARNWVGVGSLMFQPSEFGKEALALGLAGFCVANRTRLGERNRRAVVPLLAVLTASLLTVAAQKDLGAAFILFAMAGLVVCASAGRRRIGYALAFAGAFATLALASLAFPHVQDRVALWLDPTADPLREGYQFASAMAAIENGGLLGTGLGFGWKFANVPVVQSDYVLCTVVEELGLVGFAVVALAHASIARWAARLSGAFEKGTFERAAAAALSSLVVVGAFVNMAGVLNLIPMTGVVLPLVSSGGSAMLASIGSLGVLVAVASRARTAPDAVLAKVPSRPASLAAVLPLALVASFAFGCIAQAGDGGLRAVGETARATVRGSVVTADGVVLAEGGMQAGGQDRLYSEKKLASHVVGAVDGYPGFEHASARFEALLSGADCYGALEPVAELLALSHRGSDVTLTIDSGIQRAAEDALAESSGALLAMDAETGRIVALASSDPLDLSKGADAGGSFLNRATQSLVAPGSTFGLVSLAGALDRGFVDEAGSASAVWLGSDTRRAQMGSLLGSSDLRDAAEAFGFDKDVPCDLPLASSTTGSGGEVLSATTLAADRSGAKDGPSATLLQMSLVMAGIANEGTVMQPQIDQEAEPTPLFQAVSAEAAQQALASLSLDDSGGGAAQGSRLLRGRASAANRSEGRDVSWYVGALSCDDGREVVVACIVEEKSANGSAAASKAFELAEALRGDPVAQR